MNNSTCVLLLAETFKNKIITLWFIILNKIVLVSLALVLSFYHEWVGTFAYFTLECLPEKCTKVCWIFLLSFDVEPFLQTEKVDVTHRSCTFTGTKKRILCWSSNNPAESTLFVLFFLVSFHDSFYLFKLLPFFIIYICINRVWTVASLLRLFFFGVYIHSLAVTWVAYFFNCEFYSTNLQNIFFLDFVVL